MICSLRKKIQAVFRKRTKLNTQMKMNKELLRSIREQVATLRSDFSSLQKLIEGVGKKQDQHYQEFKAMFDFLLLKEVDPNLIQVITEMPDFIPEVINDCYNRFAFNNKSAQIIRQWTTEIIIQMLNNSNILQRDEMRNIARGNLARAEKTTQYPDAVKFYINILASGVTNRLPAEVILPECRDLLREKDFFRKEYRNAWFLYCVLLLEVGEKKECERLVRKWDSQFGNAYFHCLLPLAHFARALGITNKLVEKAADIWEPYLCRVKNGPALTTFLGDRSIALVGNGPQEIGLGSGEEIDAHDIVIRFSNYQIKAENTICDYGRKVNIGCISIESFVPPDTVNDLDALFCGDNLSRGLFNYEPFLDAMSNYLKTGKIYFHFGDVADIFAPLHKRMYEETGIRITTPTTGYRVAVALKALRPDLSLKNFYGFSCKSAQPVNSKGAYHYDPNQPMLNRNFRLSRHNFEFERQALRWLFLGETVNS